MTDRQVLRLTGSDRYDFLQGLVTNDLGGLANGLVYTALLTPQGKYFSDFFIEERDDSLLLDVPKFQVAPLYQRLSMYKLRSAVEISDTDLIVSRGVGDAPDGAMPDPRHPEMGWRHIGEIDTSMPVDWDALRVAHVIPQSGVELSPDSYILEMGFERLNGVSFRKGCYVGQEVTARMKHKTDLKKGLARISISGMVPVGTEIMSNGKVAGAVYTQCGGKALAYLRFDRASKDMRAGNAVVQLDQ